MKRKLIKKYQQGSKLTPAWTADSFDNLPTRKYYWRLWTPEMKVKTDYYTGEALDETWKVLVDDQGNVVDTSNPQVLADYAALSGNSNFKVEHPGVTFTFDKNTKQKFVLPTTETADERIDRMSNAPVATQELWEEIKRREDEEKFKLTSEGHKIWVHLKDKEARTKTPGAGMLFAVPTALGLGTAMFLSSPLAFTGSLIGAEVGGKTLDYPFLQQGYESFGDWWLGPNASETAKELSNLGTWLGGGLGWSALKNLDASLGLNMLKAPTMLADKYAEQLAREEVQPTVFFAKAGEVNKGSAVGVSRRPILRKNMHEFSDAEWDAAYEAALEKGNKQEMWRLLTLRFLQKAKEYIANGGGDPKVLFRGDWRDFLNFRKEGTWLSSDPLYALNYTEDRIAHDRIFYPNKVHKYFVKGTSELLLPRRDIPYSIRKSDYYWEPITSELMFGVPDELRRFASMTNSENRLLKFLRKPPKKLTAVLKKAHRLGSADVIIGEDMPVAGEFGHEHWNPSLGLEYYVANPKYVKSANLITYDNNGRMIPLSLRFNFNLNDKRYGWLLPLLPFLILNKKDQAN